MGLDVKDGGLSSDFGTIVQKSQTFVLALFGSAHHWDKVFVCTQPSVWETILAFWGPHLFENWRTIETALKHLGISWLALSNLYQNICGKTQIALQILEKVGSCSFKSLSKFEKHFCLPPKLKFLFVADTKKLTESALPSFETLHNWCWPTRSLQQNSEGQCKV